jgi:hypothetical protein
VSLKDVKLGALVVEKVGIQEMTQESVAVCPVVAAKVIWIPVLPKVCAAPVIAMLEFHVALFFRHLNWSGEPAT